MYFRSKTEKMNITISMLKLVQAPNFSLHWQFYFVSLNLPKKATSNLKQIKWTPPLNTEYSNYSRYQISALTDHFDFLEQICPKRVYLVQNFKKPLKITIEFWKLELASIHFHNILRLFDLLPNFPFTTSETMCDYYL